MNLKAYFPLGVSIFFHVGALFVFSLIKLPVSPEKKEISVVLVPLAEPEAQIDNLIHPGTSASPGPKEETNAQRSTEDESVAAGSRAPAETVASAYAASAHAAHARTETVSEPAEEPTDLAPSETLLETSVKPSFKTVSDAESRLNADVPANVLANVPTNTSADSLAELLANADTVVRVGALTDDADSPLKVNEHVRESSDDLTNVEHRRNLPPSFEPGQSTFTVPSIESFEDRVEDVVSTYAAQSKTPLAANDLEIAHSFTVIPAAPSPEDILIHMSADVMDAGGHDRVSSALGDSEIGWAGRKRKILQKEEPEFPETLQAEGQEVDVEAEITVSPAGNVKSVRITNSSGYAEVDNSVKRALRGYLFEKSQNDDNDIGVVTFRFRLEKQE